MAVAPPGSITFRYSYDVFGSLVDSLPKPGDTLTDTTGDSSATIPTELVSSNTLFPPLVTIQGYSTTTGDVLIQDEFGNQYLLSNTDTYSLGTSVNTLINTFAGTYTYCFLAGTQISTPTRTIAIEELKIGDEISTHNGRVAKVRFNFSQVKTSHIFAGKKHFPIKISANALADNVPSRDLFVTPDHAIYIPELNIFAEASTLINGISIYQVQEMPESFTYYHILCDNQEIVLAENTPAETFIDNAKMSEFDNYADYRVRYPENHEMIELDIPRAKASRQLPRALKQQLADRAELLFPSTSKVA